MKTKIASLVAIAMLSAPVMAQSVPTQTFEQQVFATQAPVHAVELSQTEMKETKGEVAPLVAIGVLAIRTGTFLVRAWTTQKRAANILQQATKHHERTGEFINVYAQNAQQARAIANQAWGKNNVIRHGQKEAHANYSHLQNTNQKVMGHVFYGKQHRFKD